MTYECKHCKTPLSTKSNLNYHIKTNKKCLNLRGKGVNSYACKNCDKTFSTKGSYSRHNKICNSSDNVTKIHLYYNNIINKQQIKYEKKLKELENKHAKEIKDLQDKIQDLAIKAIEKPTNMTNMTNIVLTPFNMNDKLIKNRIQEKYDLEYFMKGQRGVAEFTKNNLLLDTSGNLRYVCCDPSRMIFKYRDENGAMRKDVKANRLSTKITPDILTKAYSIVVDEVNKTSNEMVNNIEFYDIFMKIKELESKPEKLSTELIKLIVI